jgi:hypothetical protein
VDVNQLLTATRSVRKTTAKQSTTRRSVPGDAVDRIGGPGIGRLARSECSTDDGSR